MEGFTLFSETPCETLQKLRAKGITQSSTYIQSLETACNQKMQPVKVVANKNNILIITGVSTLIIGLIAGLIYIKKKK